MGSRTQNIVRETTHTEEFYGEILLTATQGNGKKWPLCTGDRCRQVGWLLYGKSFRDQLNAGLPNFTKLKPGLLKFPSRSGGVGNI